MIGTLVAIAVAIGALAAAVPTPLGVAATSSSPAPRNPGEAPAAASSPVLSGGSLHGVAGRRPMLRFRLAAGAGSPPLGSFTVLVPPGLSFVPGAIHGAVSARGAATSLLGTRNRLRVTLSSPVRSLPVSIGPAGLAVS
jgi:hypothetical protein